MRLLKQPLRLSLRSAWLLGEFALAAVGYVFKVAFPQTGHVSAARANWLQQGCQRALRVFNVELEVQGPIPSSGLLVCNHLSYLDILVLGALAPAAFVAKREVKFWPILGRFAKLAGTVFVDRRKRTRVGEAVENIENLLKTNVITVLFPEGTSSDGRTVLPFKSALLEPAIRSSCSLFVVCLGYELEDGDPGEEVCYWKDMTLVPHLLNLLTKQGITASVLFARPRLQRSDRKELARVLRSEIVKLKDRHHVQVGTHRFSAPAGLQNVDRESVHEIEPTSVASWGPNNGARSHSGQALSKQIPSPPFLVLHNASRPGQFAMHTGQFEKAVSAEQEAMALQQTEAEKKDDGTRLRLFEDHLPYRVKD